MDEGASVRSLRSLAEDQVLRSIGQAAKDLRAPFCVGGSLGRLPVRLAVVEDTGGGAGVRTRSGRVGASASGDTARVFELPGSREDLDALLAQCAPAVFGKGKKTVRDDSYRSALALPGARVLTQEFEAAHLTGVLAAVGRLLLPAAGPLSARLHALNAYQTGGFFKAHRDTPRGDPGFVGSLVVCLPVAHAGGGLRIAHQGRSVVYEWGPGAAQGEVQWAAFYPDCEHEVLEVSEGTRLALAFELFARQDTTSGPHAPLRALPGGRLLGALKAALDSNSFMVNGGRIGFPCQHSYPHSLLRGANEQAVRAMLKGADAAMLHALQALGVPFTLVRVWELETETEVETYLDCWEGDWDEDSWRSIQQALFVSPLAPAAGKTSLAAGQSHIQRGGGDWDVEFLRSDVGAELDPTIYWLGGRAAFPEWTLGNIGLFFGNEGEYAQEFYCSLGIVAEVPAYADRPTLQAAQLAWAGRRE